jgi:SM-20-related protein
MTFTLNPAFDRQALASSFAAQGFVSVKDFLHYGADQLGAALTARDDWRLAVNAGETVYDLDVTAMTAEQKRELDQRIEASARDAFQFRFSSIRVPDAPEQRSPATDIVHAFAEFMRSEAVLNFVAEVTGCNAICFADAQATAYHPGDFLTGHDDDISGKHRECAYVMALTPDWRVEWGGLLLFHNADGTVQGLAPQFNCLNLFAVPVLHSVSQVTQFAGAVRYSVTGWLRSQRP